jgi:hypothetical protein
MKRDRVWIGRRALPELTSAGDSCWGFDDLDEPGAVLQR